MESNRKFAAWEIWRASGFFSVISCLSLFLKIRKPRPQRERAQWDIGIAHAEKALKMTREERIEQYTFIYIDKEPEEVLSKGKKTAASKSETKKNRRPKPALNTQAEHANVVAASPSSAELRRQSQRRQSSVEEEEPPPVKIAWKTAAARKSLPASITMHNLDLQKCNMSPVVKIEQVFALQNAAGDGKLIDQFVYSTKVRALWSDGSCSSLPQVWLAVELKLVSTVHYNTCSFQWRDLTKARLR